VAWLEQVATKLREQQTENDEDDQQCAPRRRGDVFRFPRSGAEFSLHEVVVLEIVFAVQTVIGLSPTGLFTGSARSTVMCLPQTLAAVRAVQMSGRSFGVPPVPSSNFCPPFSPLHFLYVGLLVKKWFRWIEISDRWWLACHYRLHPGVGFRSCRPSLDC
jgi:hypothetical protein